MGFCTAPSMLVCAVLQSEVRHVGDAMVVQNADHVVPLFEAKGQWYSPAPSHNAQSSKLPAPAASRSAKAATVVAPKKSPPKATPKKHTSSKLKARLEKLSQR